VLTNATGITISGAYQYEEVNYVKSVSDGILIPEL